MRDLKSVNSPKAFTDWMEYSIPSQPPYTPDLALSDYYLFRSLLKILDSKTFKSNEKIKNHLVRFVASKKTKI